MYKCIEISMDRETADILFLSVLKKGGSLLGQKIFLSVFCLVFAMTLAVQGYLFLFDDAMKERRAERMGAEFVDRSELVAEEVGGMTVYLTVETANGNVSAGTLCINGVAAGDLSRGILTVAAEENDIISIKQGKGESFRIVDYPAILDENDLTETIDCTEDVTKWGKISFR